MKHQLYYNLLLHLPIHFIPLIIKIKLAYRKDDCAGKAADFKFGQYIQRIHLNKSLLKILEERERGLIQGLPKFFGYPLLSQEQVKL